MAKTIWRIEKGQIAACGGGVSISPVTDFPTDFPADDFNNCYILPGFTDVHVHLREPGFLYKETIETGTRAAAAGGFTSICAMPNLKPCPDSMENLQVQLDAIRKDATIRVHPYGTITRGQQGKELAELEELASHVIAFTDDGFGVISDELMKKAMTKAGELGKIIVAHCEDERYPKESNETEWRQLERDLRLVRETGCAYHACHISTRESVELIRAARAEGLDVSCETAPHYLTLTREDVEHAKAADSRPGRFKMNPPIKFEEDRQALLEAVIDGTIDMIATDHAPHSTEEKRGGFGECAYGIVGLETAFPVLYTKLVKKRIMTLERLVEMMSTAPAERFNLGEERGWSVWNLDEEYEIETEKFRSKGRSTPFEGWKVQGRCLATYAEGKEVYRFD
ncbi:MAG: dihydroorotase [Clostridia bacterium]|nr:dihydroorotase [Clostridia bacterium]